MRKPTTLTFLLIALSVTAIAQQPDPDFPQFAARQDSLEVQAYQNKDIPEYTRQFHLLLARYRRLDPKQQADYKGYCGGGWYNLACTYSLLGRSSAALDCLDSAVKAGWTDYAHTTQDADLVALHNDPRFTSILRPLKETYDYLYIIGKADKFNPADNRPIPAWSYQPATDSNLIALRKGLDLDSIAGGGDDVTRVLHLMHWMHDLIPHDGSRNNPVVKNAMSMIAVCRRDHGTLNCRGLAIALNECLLALGYHSRYVTCLPKDSLGIDNDCHVIDMVYIPSLKKWIWVDPTFDAYVMNEAGELLGLEEVRQRLIDHRPLILNPDANWNHRNGESKNYYLYTYMAKNLYRLECAVNSCYDLETHTPGKESYEGPDKVRTYVYHTNNAAAFWANP